MESIFVKILLNVRTYQTKRMSSIVSSVLDAPAKILGFDNYSQYGLIILIGALILFGLIFTSSTSTTLKQRSKKAIVPKVPKMQPKTVLPQKISPKITKLDFEKTAPVMNPKSYEPIEEKVEVIEEKEVVEIEKTLEEPPVEVVAEEKIEIEVVEPPAAPPSELPTLNDVDSTFEAYRQAMLASGPRQMEEEMRHELFQTKSFHSYRNQQRALKQKLNMSTAEFLESNNTSINDRLVAMFDSI